MFRIRCGLRFLDFFFIYFFFFLADFHIIGPTGYVFSLQTVFLHVKNVLFFCFVLFFFLLTELYIQNVSASIYKNLHSLIANHLGSLSTRTVVMQILLVLY